MTAPATTTAIGLAAASPRRGLHVEHCMGTVFTIDIRDQGDWQGPIEGVVRWLHHVDAVFSTYRPDSDISRINRGELRAPDADPLVTDVLGLCAEIHHETDGYFSARHTNALDPTGLVKGWAIDIASDLLRAAGSRNHVVNGGGDMQIAGEAAPGDAWQIGLSDPRNPQSLIGAIACGDGAIATSGISERGAHIRNPYTDEPGDTLLSLTVLGERLTRVDAYATAAFARGSGALLWLDSLPGYSGLAVDREGSMRCSRHWPGVRPGPA